MMKDLHRILQLIEDNWRKIHVLVVGDVMLDRFVWGDVERISPEAPVPIVRVVHRSEQPGGAANVAMNIVGLGAKASLFGFCGKDADGESLHTCLAKAGVDAHMLRVESHPTTTKQRVMSGRQQMLRLDMERPDGYSGEEYEELIASVEETMPSADAIVLSDYAKGVLSEEACQRIIQRAREHGLPVLVDPKQRSFTRYRGATTICPNLSELSVATGVAAKELSSILEAGRGMIPKLALDFLTVTLSEKGIAVLREDTQRTFPAVAQQVFDVSGAGDTVIATLALSLASGLEIETAVPLANIAAGVVVSKVGTVPITREELATRLMPEIELQAEEKVLTLNRLRTRVSAWRANGQSVVFTNGCFDLLHIGHITLLEDARRQGDRLIVGINSDQSVRELKGPTRPMVGERERAYVLAALAAVDAVVIFAEATPLALMEALRPDVIVKGGDYSEETVVGAKEVRSWGGRVKIIPTVEGFSTTRLIAKAAAPVLP
ncbi:bifunctional D-glycero-beta-D-manno-heptose-7-phosphate kinase/D-glycero-beta-D-manno-heptose 1-phosphate adenylyltransferase HldE [Silvibacterium dinghuense]|uniref:Bifunctional protein HldE n=1 Tax=Silvibacterium dinghuense TaxID=1560006 RepID=A0A4Q1S894_9BACT|nr:bifunctional D-glycero-beta-D-manno-heptose-7-phosphate kinase/D-glycero-beta-D-manno-heptose 1-phosphate adenylyltransferase HldE [Silvibacterium dinghuense]RXS93047.1 bifunctional D-glycero-beta-D-manno-heptose-7-phosphate kinase/D-glycero-beta-D-manno-heptose 1-phosphate adenylyltransferase HldE [Silvibacterium dinghuense]GGG89873.1 bifunctional protein HldE [Silvibacterium dinghuense]